MLEKDIRPGVKVRVIKKSILSNSFEQFSSKYPKGIATIKKYDALNQTVHVDDWHFSPNDIILVEGTPLKSEDLYIGRLVRVIGNSINPKNLERFISLCPNAIGTITSMSGVTGFIYVNDIAFLLQDLVSDLRTKEQEEQKEIISPHVIGIKPITIENLIKEGACEDELKKFIHIVTQLSASYAYHPIPPRWAQEVATSLGYPNWLVEHGFIKINKREVIKSVKVIDNKDYFSIQCNEDPDKIWSLFRVYKDGRGFYRAPSIFDSGITLDEKGRIAEVSK